MSTLGMPTFFDKGLANIDPAIGPFFGDLDGKQTEPRLKPDPYPLMYLDDQSQAVGGIAPEDLGHQQAQYVASSVASPSLDAATGPRTKAPPPRPRPAPPASRSSGGTTDNSASASRSRTKSTRSKSGSVSGDNAANAAAEDDRSKRREPRRKGSKASEDGNDRDAKRDSVLARNRVAALKCRRKKKEFVSDLEEQRIELEQKHQRLQDEYATLLSEATSIKNNLMDHANCNDPHIDNWLDLEARRFVQTTKERYSRTYGSVDGLTYEELIDTAAPVASALSGPAVTSGASTERSSTLGSVASPSSRRNSFTHSQGGVPPMAYAMQPSPPSTWVNPLELTTYPTHSAQTSPVMPNFDLSLSGEEGDGLRP